jgi:hypothetical protein
VTQELVRREPPDIEVSWRFAQGFAKSGYFPDTKSAEQALVKIVAGAEMGLMPFQAMTGIAIIQGKPVVGAGLLAAMLDQHPDYAYEVEWEPDQANATACTVVIFKGGKERGRSRFSLEDAERAGLSNKDNWKKFPPAMLFARAMSQGCRWYAPGLTGTSAYVEGEILPDPPPANVVATVVPYAAPDDPMDDVPFDVAPASPTAESPPDEGQIAAEPVADPLGANGDGLIIDSLADAQRLVNQLSSGEQLATMKRMLGIDAKTTRRLMADALFAQRSGWDSDDVLRELAGW